MSTRGSGERGQIVFIGIVIALVVIYYIAGFVFNASVPRLHKVPVIDPGNISAAADQSDDADTSMKIKSGLGQVERFNETLNEHMKVLNSVSDER